MKLSFLRCISMFVVYDPDTKCVRTDEKLKSIILEIEDGFIVKFSAPTMPPISLNMKNIIKKVDFIECVGSFVEKFLVNIKIIDCGKKITTWISTYIINYFTIIFCIYILLLRLRHFTSNIRH